MLPSMNQMTRDVHSSRKRLTVNRKTIYIEQSQTSLSTISSVQFSSVTQSCPTLCDPMDYRVSGFLSFTISQSLLKLISTESVMSSSHLILCHPLLLLPSIFPSNRVFSNELALRIRWPSIGASALASVLPVYIQGWFPLGLTDLILLSNWLSSVFSRYSIYTCSMDVQLDWMCN